MTCKTVYVLISKYKIDTGGRPCEYKEILGIFEQYELAQKALYDKMLDNYGTLIIEEHPFYV